MSVPPPPNQWGSQPPTGGQPRAPAVGTAAWASGAPQWGPQQPWGPPPGPPPSGGGKGKWILAGIAVLAVIAVTVVITVLVVGKDSGGANHRRRRTAIGSDFASANDKGPVDDHHRRSDLRVDDTDPQTLADVREKWMGRSAIRRSPASAWTPTMRAQYEASGKAMRSAADQMVPLAKLTPHRVMRELYEQFIAYSRAYADRIPTYTPPDDNSQLVSSQRRRTPIANICAAISYGSASARGPLVPPPAPPSQVAPAGRSRRPSAVPHRIQPCMCRLDGGVGRSSERTPSTGWLSILISPPASGRRNNGPSMTLWHR